MPTTKQITRHAGRAGLISEMVILPVVSAGTDNPPRLISTQGRGEAWVRPDSLRVNLGVEAQATTLEEARTQAARSAQRLLQALGGLQIQGLNLQTQTIQVYPVRETPRGDELPKTIGFRVANSIAATVLDASPDDLGAFASRIVDTALASGATQIGGISLFTRNIRRAQDRALRAAVRDARRTACAMAKAAGVRLGAVRSIEGSPSYQGGLAMRAFEAAAAPTPVSPGETVVASTVSVSFEIGRDPTSDGVVARR